MLQHETQQNKADIKEVRNELKDLRKDFDALREDFSKLMLVVQKLAHDIERGSEREEYERNNLALQLKNEMLQFERRLPPAKTDTNIE